MGNNLGIIPLSAALTCGVCYDCVLNLFKLLRVCVFIAVDRLAVAIQQVSADTHDAGNH